MVAPYLCRVWQEPKDRLDSSAQLNIGYITDFMKISMRHKVPPDRIGNNFS